MASEIILRDQNFVTVLAGITDNASQEIKMLRVDPSTGRLLVSATGGGTVSSISSSTGILLTPNPITSTGTVGLSTALAPMATLAGNSLKVLRVNAGETAVEYATVSSGGITIGTTTITSGTTTRILYNNAGVVGEYTLSGSGTVVAMATSPAFTTPSLGVATATSINGLTLTSSTGVVTITNGKTLAVTNTLTFSGTDSTVMTFPTTSATIARTDAANTFTGTQTFNGTVALGAQSLTMTGSLAATGARVTKGWFTDVESTNMPTVGGTSLTTVAQTFQNKTITNSNNVLGGVTMTLGSDADGDIYYRSSNVLTRLPKGTTLQQLRMNAGATAPEWATISGGDVYALSAKPTTYYTYVVPLFAAGDVESSDNQASGWTVANYNTTSDWNGIGATLITNATNAFMYNSDNSGTFTFPGTGSTLAHTFASTKKTVLSLRFKGDANGNWAVGLGTNTNANWYTANSTTGDRAVFTYDGTNFRTLTDSGTAITSNIIAGTVTNWNTLRIEFDPASECRFYVNGTLMATHNTNLPNGGTVFVGSGHSATGRTYYMTQPTVSIEI